MLIESGAFVQTQIIIPCLWILTDLEQDRTLPLCNGLVYIIGKIVANYQHIGLIYETIVELIMKQLDDRFQSIFSRMVFSGNKNSPKFSSSSLLMSIKSLMRYSEVLGRSRPQTTATRYTEKLLKLMVFSNNSLKKSKSFDLLVCSWNISRRKLACFK